MKENILLADSGDKISIHLSARQREYFIIDSMGQELMQFNTKEGSTITIDKSAFCPGIYLLCSHHPRENQQIMIL